MHGPDIRMPALSLTNTTFTTNPPLAATADAATVLPQRLLIIITLFIYL